MPSVTCASGTIISGAGIAAEAAVVGVAHDADDLARGLLEFRSTPLPMTICCPTGFWLGKYCLASASLMRRRRAHRPCPGQ